MSNEETNDDVETTIDGVHLCPVGGTSGGHEFMNLNAGKVMNRQTIKTIPITDAVTQKVEELATAQGTTEIEFHDKKLELRMHNIDWEHGVDYDDADDNDEADNNPRTEQGTDDTIRSSPSK